MNLSVKYLILNLKASALSFALSLLLIISTLLLLFVTERQYYLSFLKKEITFYKASLNAELGLSKAKNLERLTQNYDLISAKNYRLERYRLGFYDLIQSSGFYLNDSVKLLSLQVEFYPQIENYALISMDRSFNNPVYVTGETEIKGDIYSGRYSLSAQSIKNLYYKKKYINEGEIHRNDLELNLTLNKDRYKELEKLKISSDIDDSKEIYLGFRTIRLESLNGKKIYGPGSIIVDKITSEDNFIIHNANIFVRYDVKIVQAMQRIVQSALIVDGNVEIGIESKNLQILSKGKISLLNRANLLKNSLLYSIPNENDIRFEFTKIKIEEYANFRGSILIEKNEAIQTNAYIPLQNDSRFQLSFILYNPYGTNSEMSLNGTIITNYFQIHYYGTKYQNYIKDLRLHYEKIATGNIFNEISNSRIEKAVRLE